jgi:MFS family permease
VSIVLGLAYTFYSGAVEAWLVDALHATGHRGPLDPVFARGGMVASGAMLVGTIGGGLLGTADLAWPYLARTALLVAAFAVAFAGMHDLGFEPRAVRFRDIKGEVGKVARASVRYGWGHPPVRLLLLVSFLQFGVGAWAFYAWQPYFLDLLGRPDAIWVAGVVASLIALAGIAGNALVGPARKVFARRSTILIAGGVAYALSLAGVGLVGSFLPAAAIYLAGTLIGRVAMPVRQAYFHEIIPSAQRATVTSFDGLFGSLGSVGGQTGLGYLAQQTSIPVGFVASGAIAGLAVPILWALRRIAGPADRIEREGPELPAEPAEASSEAPT